MSLKSVELWRPRREPGERGRRVMAIALAVGLLAASLILSVVLHRSIVLFGGLAAALVLSLVWGRLLGGGITWTVSRPRPWVPRVRGSRRPQPGPDRRTPLHRRPLPLPAAEEPCNPQSEPRRVASGGDPQV